MDAYEMRFKSSALKELKRLAEKDATRVLAELKALREQPRPKGAKKLRLGKNLWRIRVGDLRVIHEVDDDSHAVRIVRIRHRDEAYR